MKYILFLIVLFSICNADIVHLGSWNKQSLSKFLFDNVTNSNDMKIQNITDKFLNTPYKANTLIGSATQKEELVIDLGHLDCFTFIDYIEAMKDSSDYNQFQTNLVKLRYQEGKIEYSARNHFLTDWIRYNGFKNISSSLTTKTKQVTKSLNQSKDKKVFKKKDETGVYR